MAELIALSSVLVVVRYLSKIHRLFFCKRKQRFLSLKTLARYLAGVFLLGFSLSLLADELAPSCFLSQDTDFQVVKVKRVIDGDTIELTDGRKARLIGINTPERELSLGKKAGKKGAEPYYKEAKVALERAVKGNKVKVVVAKRPVDRYGRSLLYLYSEDNVFLPGELIRQGLGFRIAFSPDLMHQACLQELELESRQGSKGVWSSDYWQVMDSNVTDSGFQLINGTVSTIDESRYFWWVDLQSNVTLKISKKYLSKDEVDRFAGQEIQVRGWLVDRRQSKSVLQKGYKPWLMTVTDVSNIKIMKTLP